jgi:glucan phosphoethanolaminetransferase (alkaline phosphatase superfamily)
LYLPDKSVYYEVVESLLGFRMTTTGTELNVANNDKLVNVYVETISMNDQLIWKDIPSHMNRGEA